MDFCGCHSICSVYEAFGLVLLVAFRVFVAFKGNWGHGGTLLAFTALVSVYEALGLNVLWRLRCLYCLWSVWGDVCEFHSVCSVYEAFGPVVFCGVQSVCSVYGTLGMDPCGVYSISSVYGALGLDVCGVTAFVTFMGSWRCTFGTLFKLYVSAQYRRVLQISL